MSQPTATAAAKSLVAAFFTDVRSGANLAAAATYLAPRVIAHQLCSEEPLAIERSPADYAGHVREMIAACTGFHLSLDQLIAEDDLVYARWTQRGVYAIPDDDDFKIATPIVEFASAVYRVAGGKIVEYWMQVDRLGTQRQVDRV